MYVKRLREDSPEVSVDLLGKLHLSTGVCDTCGLKDVKVARLHCDGALAGYEKALNDPKTDCDCAACIGLPPQGIGIEERLCGKCMTARAGRYRTHREMLVEEDLPLLEENDYFEGGLTK
jgi:hypothetical protein